MCTNVLSKFSGVKSYPNEWNVTQKKWKYCHYHFQCDSTFARWSEIFRKFRERFSFFNNCILIFLSIE